MGPRFRTVVRSPRFEQELKEIQPAARLADQATEGLEWVLARNPLYGAPIGSETVWATPLYTLGPNLLVYYRHDENSVTLLSIVESEI